MAKTVRLFEPKRTHVPKREEFRGSRHERGYDSEWERASTNHRKRFPLCAECEHHGRTRKCDVVDHKIPVADRPDLRLDPRNRWSLCHFCHNGIKRKMEAYARAAGRIDELIAWCDDPSTRPPVLMMRRKSARKQEFIV